MTKSVLDLTPTMMEIEKRLNPAVKPTQIAKELKISIATYYNLLTKINERNNTSEMKAQYEEEVTSAYRMQLLEALRLYDLAKELPEKAQILKLMNDILKTYTDYLMKTGRIKEVSKKVEIESNVKVDYHNLYEIYLEEKKAKQLPSGNIIDQQSNRSSV